jgi:hypothetical protein
MPRESRKTKAREAAIFAIPMMVSGFAWYVIPSGPTALYWLGAGALILGYAGYLWWKADA